MKQLILGFIIGSVIGGMWVQYRITGSIADRKTIAEYCEEAKSEGYREGFNYGAETEWNRWHKDNLLKD